MKKAVGRLAPIGLLTGCTLLGGGQRPVLGTWGALNVELSATNAGISINFGCYQVTFPGPVPLVHGDSFGVLNGTVTHAAWDAQIGQRWRISGAIRGDTLALALTHILFDPANTWGDSESVKLRAGPGTFHFVACAE